MHAHQISRGDLLRWMRHKTEEEKRLSAPLLGYEWREPQPKMAGKVGKVDDPYPLDKSSEQGKSLDVSATHQRPPEAFYALSRRERYANPEDQEDGLPAGLCGVQPLLDDELQPFAAGQPLQHQPLLPEQRLLPFLRQALVYPLGQRLNIPQLIKQAARLQVLQRLPRLPHTVPAGRVYVLVDVSRRLRPFWEDAHAVCRLIERKHGRNGLDIRVVEDDPQAPYWDWFDEQQRLQAWVKLKFPSTVLILSDMGQLSAQGSAVRQRWLRFAQQLHHQGLCPVVLSPISPQHQCPRLQALTYQVLWSRHSRLKPQKLNQRWADHTAYVQRVLGLLSVAVHIEPELLRAVLAGLPAYQADSGVEADIYQHPDVVWGHTAISLRAAKRQQWQAQFQREAAEVQQQVLALLQQHHIGQFPAVWAEEVLNVQPLVNFPSEGLAYLKQAEDFMVRFTRRFAGQSGHEGMAQFARRHLQRLGVDKSGKALYQARYTSALYGLAYRESLQAGEVVPSAYDAGIVQAVLRQRIERRHYRLAQCGEYLEIFAADQERDGFAAGVSLAEFEAVHDTLLVRETHPFPLYLKPDEREIRVCALHGQAVMLDTGLEWLEMTPLTQPAWASRIWQTATGLWASIVWLGKAHHLRWQPAEPDKAGHWAWPSPFAEDHYGLYADLEIKGITQRFRWIEPGTFLMGSSESEAGHYDDEVQHLVTLTQGIWLADTTVTQSLWQAVMGNNPSYFKDNPTNPVEGVSWNDVQYFIQKLNAHIPGLQAKLPTEAQWEYACRAGTTTPFSFGNNITPEQVNYNGNYPYVGDEKGLYREKTVPVKSLPATPWGLYEMHGNVWEWCQDWWQQEIPAEPVIDPKGLDTGVRCVIRGGSWRDGGGFCRSAFRRGFEPDVRFNDVGFRLALGHASACQIGKSARL